MERTKAQQNELDNVEKHILITLFGSENIPNSTATGLKLLQINPNEYINKFENLLTPIMKKDGKLDGKMLKKLMQMSKYREMLDYIHVPDDDFLLSDIICTLMSKFVPGVTA